jgi:hypothetical protein
VNIFPSKNSKIVCIILGFGIYRTLKKKKKPVFLVLASKEAEMCLTPLSFLIMS